MKKRQWVALGIAGAACIMAAVATWTLRDRVDPGHLAQVARDKAREAFSRDLTLGAISFNLLPRPVLVAQDVSLANPPWAKDPRLLHADRVTAYLAPWPLLRGEVAVRQLSLEGVAMDLEVAPDGTRSWQLHPAQGNRAHADFARMPLEVKIASAEVRYRSQAGESELWRLGASEFAAGAGLRDARIDVRVTRRNHPLHATARLADLSRLGEQAAATQATIVLDWGKTRLSAEGRVPLHPGMDGAAFAASLDSSSLEDMLDFFEVDHRHTAPLKAHADVAGSEGVLDLRRLSVSLGNHRVDGDAQIRMLEAKPRFVAHLESDRLDWVQALLDAGNAPYPPLPPDELFYDRPIAWPLLVAMAGKQGVVDLKIGRLVLRNGVELRNVKTRAAFDGDRLELKPFATELLGGTAAGTLRFVGRKRQVHVGLVATNILLERWFHERHRSTPFTAGPMKLRAEITATGASMKQLAASMTGPVSIVMGPGVYASKAAGDWEARMVRFSKKQSVGAIEFECAGAALPFVSGRAAGESIVAARSRETRIVTSGYVDFRQQAVDLRGRLRAKPGEGIGLSTIASDLRIAGNMRAMKVKLDPASTPKVIAKAGVAIATLGASVAASSAANSARGDPDPCEAVFAPGHPRPP